jgi:hypothetical protein
MPNRPRTTLSFASLFSPPFHIRAIATFLTASEFPLLFSCTRPHPHHITNFLFSFFIFPRPTSPIKPAGALDGNDHHDSDQGCFEFTSKDCAWTLIFVTDDEPDASGHSEDFAFASTLDLTQPSKPGERTVFRYGCHPRGWYGCTKPHPTTTRRTRTRTTCVRYGCVVGTRFGPVSHPFHS